MVNSSSVLSSGSAELVGVERARAAFVALVAVVRTGVDGLRAPQPPVTSPAGGRHALTALAGRDEPLTTVDQLTERARRERLSTWGAPRRRPLPYRRADEAYVR